MLANAWELQSVLRLVLKSASELEKRMGGEMAVRSASVMVLRSVLMSASELGERMALQSAFVMV